MTHLDQELNSEYSPVVSVVIPAFNEAATIREIIQRVASLPIDLQLVVVDDGSTDGTSEIIHEIVKENPAYIAISHSANRGKGSAIRTALDSCVGRYIVVQDADLEYCPEDYHAILAPLKNEKADLVLGSRYLETNKNDLQIGFGSRVAVMIINNAMKLIYGFRITDSLTCYKACRTSWLKQIGLECERFEFCTEVLAKAARSGLRVLEVPVEFSPRKRNEGKKIGWRDGWSLLTTAIRLRNWVQPGQEETHQSN